MAAVRRHLGARKKKKKKKGGVFRLDMETGYLCKDEKWLLQICYHLYNNSYPIAKC